MPDLSHPLVPQLSEFDRLLAHGPYYEKLALQGAAVGGVLSLLVGAQRGKLSHALTYGIAVAGVAVGGAILLFGLGKVVSGRSHDAIAAGSFYSGRGFHPHHHHQHQDQDQGQGQGQGDDDDGQGPPPPPPHHHGFGHRWR
jgi:hypothetical protein